MSGFEASGTRGAVRDGLRRLVRRIGPPPAADEPPAGGPSSARLRWRNLLLDEVGSDARALVDLLLRVQAHGVVAAIPPGPLGPAAWAPLRARLAFGHAAETFLDADMARWAVDAWGYALGAIEAGALYVAPPTAPLPAPVPVAASSPAGPSPAAVRTPAASYAVAPPPAPAKIPGRVRRAIARANAPPPPNPFPPNFDRIAGYTFAGVVTLAAVGIWLGIVDRREAGGLDLPAEPVLAAVGAPAPAIAPLPSGADDAPGGAPDDAEPGGRSRAPGRVAADAVDSLRLRDGTVRTGRVERLTADALVLRDPWSDSTARVDLGDVVEWRTRHGEVVPVGELPPAPPADSVPASPAVAPVGAPVGASAGAPVGAPVDAVLAGAAEPGAVALGALPPGAGDLGHAARVAGLAGRYTVRRRVLEVSGSESCGAVAAAVRAAAPTVETVAHRPGEAEFVLTSRPGLRGTVDDDGRFRTAVVEGARNGVEYRFRMVGQVLPDGFRAETESETRTVLRWRDVQHCRVSVALDAERLR